MTSGGGPKLSVNVNKVATLRNSRGGEVPSLAAAVQVVLAAGARGITVHPRADQRHITPRDVRDLAALLAPRRADVEFNIEGDPRPDLLALVHEVRPHQCTLVPVKAGEITSQAGWPPGTPRQALAGVIADLRAAGVRVSLFVDPDVAAVAWAADLGAELAQTALQQKRHEAIELHLVLLGIGEGGDPPSLYQCLTAAVLRRHQRRGTVTDRRDHAPFQHETLDELTHLVTAREIEHGAVAARKKYRVVFAHVQLDQPLRVLEHLARARDSEG